MRAVHSLPDWLRAERTVHAAVGSGIVLLFAGGLHGFLFGPQRLLESWLAGLNLWAGLAVGCLALLMISNLSRARAVRLLARPLAAAARSIWIFAFLFVPILLGASMLFPWMSAELMASSDVAHRAPWLNLPLFGVRALLYFFAWSLLAHLLTARRATPDDSGRRLRAISVVGIAVVTVTVTFAVWDWIISLEPRWSSAMLGFNLLIGNTYAAAGFAAFIAIAISRTGAYGALDQERTFKDLSNILLLFVLGWVYLNLSQHLIVWSGNLPANVVWYVPRFLTNWNLLAIAIAAFHVAVPFALLGAHLLRSSKIVIAVIGLAVVAMKLPEILWIILPSFRPEGMAFHWLDFVIPAGIGALWFGVFVWHLQNQPVESHS